MARQRVLRPEIWESETFLRLSIVGRLTFIWLISNADDCGIVVGSVPVIRDRAFCGLKISEKNVAKALDELEEKKAIFRYDQNGSKYIILCNWFKYQHLDRPNLTTKPLPFENQSGIDQESIAEWSAIIREKFRSQSGIDQESFPLSEKKRIEKNRKEKNPRLGDGSVNDRGIIGEDLEGLRSVVSEYGVEWCESVGKKIFELGLGDDDVRDALTITCEKQKDLRYTLGILERKKREDKVIRVEEEKKQKYYEIEMEKEQTRMQEWQENSLSPEENIDRLQEMISGLGQKMAIPIETDASVSL